MQIITGDLDGLTFSLLTQNGSFGYSCHVEAVQTHINRPMRLAVRLCPDSLISLSRPSRWTDRCDKDRGKETGMEGRGVTGR